MMIIGFSTLMRTREPRAAQKNRVRSNSGLFFFDMGGIGALCLCYGEKVGAKFLFSFGLAVRASRPELPCSVPDGIGIIMPGQTKTDPQAGSSEACSVCSA